MKNVIIIIRPNKYFDTKNALISAGFTAFSSKLVSGRGCKGFNFSVAHETNSDNEIAEYPLIAKKEISITIPDEKLDSLVKIIMKINSTGNPGDGKIFVLPVITAIRIRTNEKNENALA